MGYEFDFLAVGEAGKSGDSIVLRVGNLRGTRDEQRVIVVDGGFESDGDRVVRHIRRYYDTDRVDVVVSTHPDADHANGLKVVLRELRVAELWMHQPWNHTADIARLFRDGRVTDRSVSERLRKALDGAKELEQIALARGIPIVEPFAGHRDSTGTLVVAGPTEEYYESLLPAFRSTPEQVRVPAQGLFQDMARRAADVATRVLESLHLETLTDLGETSAENNSSTVLLVSTGSRNALLTADAGIPALERAADLLDYVGFDMDSLRLVQIPHHGSKRNVGPTVLDRILGNRRTEEKLRSAFVSAASDGGPKHPSKRITNAFKRRGAWPYATRGTALWHHHEAPPRADYSTATPLPLYPDVSEE